MMDFLGSWVNDGSMVNGGWLSNHLKSGVSDPVISNTIPLTRWVDDYTQGMHRYIGEDQTPTPCTQPVAIVRSLICFFGWAAFVRDTLNHQGYSSGKANH